MMKQRESMLTKPTKIIDISIPVTSSSACFPGDTPFSRQITVDYESSKVINLTAMTMSPHVGTHTDSPAHVRGDLTQGKETAGEMPLEPFIGECVVVDLSPFQSAIKPEHIETAISNTVPLPARVLFRTSHHIRYDVFEDDYPYFSQELVDYMSERGVVLMGIDCPSVDHVRSKSLDVHHRLLEKKMYWLENLDLTQASAGRYFLVALPIKFMELEASPVRAVLLDYTEGN